MKKLIAILLVAMVCFACSEKEVEILASDNEARASHAEEMAIFWKGLQVETCGEYPNPNCLNDHDSSPKWYLKEASCYFEKEILTTPDYPYEWPHYDSDVYKNIYKCYFPGSNDELAHQLWLDLNKFNLFEANIKELKQSSNQHVTMMLESHESDRERLQPLFETCESLMRDKSKKWLPIVCWPHAGGNWDCVRGWTDDHSGLRDPDYKF